MRISKIPHYQFAATLLGLTMIIWPGQALAHTTVSICNKGDTELYISTVHGDDLFIWDDKWRSDGHYIIDRGRCETWSEFSDGIYFAIGYSDADGNFGYPEFEGRRIRKNNFFCIDPTNSHGRDGSLASMRNCPSGYVKAPFQLYFKIDSSVDSKGFLTGGTHFTQDIKISKNNAPKYIVRLADGSEAKTGNQNRGSNSGGNNSAAEPKIQATKPFLTQVDECFKARGCAVHTLTDGRRIYNILGNDEWFFENGAPAPSDLVPKEPVAEKNPQLEKLVGDLSKLVDGKTCRIASARSVLHPAREAIRSIDGKKLSYRYALSPFFGRYTYTVAHFDAVSVHPKEITTRRIEAGDCWEVVLRKTSGKKETDFVVYENTSVKKATNGQKYLDTSESSSDRRVKLYFSNQEDAEQAARAIQSYTHSQIGMGHWFTKRLPGFVEVIVASFGIGLFVLALPTAILGAVFPNYIYPFQNPKRLRSALYGLLGLPFLGICFFLLGLAAAPPGIEEPDNSEFLALIGFALAVGSITTSAILGRKRRAAVGARTERDN